MDCQICGAPAQQRPIKASGMHDALVLCHAHATHYLTVALTDGWSGVRYLMEAPIDVTEPATVEVSSMKDSRRPYTWDRPQVRRIGANPQSDVPQFRSHSWVNAFTHKATDPHKAWRTQT